VFLTKPNGETRKLSRAMLLNNPRVPEGSVIHVSRKPAKPKEEKQNGPTVGEVIKDVFAITASALTIIILAIQIQKG
jgi:hypothetical protein